MTTIDDAAEFYGYAREVWRVWSARAGWRGRVNSAEAIQAAAAHCWAVRNSYNPEKASRRSYFTLCARRYITEMRRKQRVRENQARLQSLDVRYNDGAGRHVVELVDAQPRPCELAETNDELARMMNALGELEPRERYAVWQHFGEGSTLDQIGAALGLSREGARQVEAKAVRKLTATLARGMVHA